MVPSPKPPHSPLGAVSEAEHEKPKNHRNERRNVSTTCLVDVHVFFSNSRTESGSRKPPSEFASKSKRPKQISVSVDHTKSPMLPKKRKRKNSEKQKQAEEKSEVSVELFTSSLVMYPCKGNKLIKTSENNLSNVELSTKLMLRDGTWPTKDNIETYTPILSDADMREALLAYKIGLMKNYRPEEVEHERRTGVSTKLKLFSYPWNITKRLTTSDLHHLSRLLVKTCQVEEHVLPFLDAALIDEINSKGGWPVAVWDHDANSMHNLVFKKWSTSNSYVFISNWKLDFVQRRDLSEGDEIGLYWDRFYSRFSFSVLDRAPGIPVVAADQ